MRTKSFPFNKLKNQPMAELVWAGFFWGRYNMGAIEFSLPPLILDDFGALFHVIARK